MNEQQPYEKRLAEKFQQLPLPDVEPNWQQMKLLLDKRMPRGGAYWKWITGIGIIIIMLLGGTWLITHDNEPLVAKIVQPAGNDQGIQKQKAGSDVSRDSESPKKNAAAQKSDSPPEFPEANGKDSDPSLNNIANQTIVNEETVHDGLNTTENKIPGTLKRQDRKNSSVESRIKASDNTQNPTGYEHAPNVLDKGAVTGNRYRTNQIPSKPDLIETPTKNAFHDGGLKTSRPVFNTTLTFDTDLSKLAGDSINEQYYVGLFPVTTYGNEQKQVKNKSSKSKDILAGENKSVAIGFSLPLGFPLGDQKPGAYNINARPNVISDFIPVPHMQYHINNKLYLQTELQLMNPQYIQPVLLYQQKNEVPATNTVYLNSVYAKKLYYFNLPVGIHYSPFQHFYLGTGLQFSSLVSGVALHEQTKSVIGSNRYDLMNQRYAKFRNDTLSQRIDNNEFRLMLDANYYWRQFTVGLRYNQALSNYVSFRLNNASPLFQDKNKSLQFYLRYNLWENHKKTSLVKTK